MTRFEDLNGELLFEIFDYLSFEEIFNALYDLQQRINKCIRTYPSAIVLSDKDDIEKIKDGQFLCRSLALNSFHLKDIQAAYSCLNFEAIRGVQFHYITSNSLIPSFGSLPMQQLESITIKSWEFDNDPDSTYIDRQILTLITMSCQNQLLYLNAPFRKILPDVKQSVPFVFQSLKYASFKSISTNEMSVLLRHAPQLRYCKTGLTIGNDDDYCEGDFLHTKLTDLRLTIKNCSSFEKLKRIFSCCPNLQTLVLQLWISTSNMEIATPSKWQQLIEQDLLYLQSLELKFCRHTPWVDDLGPFESDVAESFNNSEFWRQRSLDFNVTV